MSQNSYVTVTNGTNETDKDPGWEEVVHGIEVCYSLTLIVLGSIGNCISVLVFFTTKLKKLSSSFYLAALAISDTGFLIALFMTWLNSSGVPLFRTSGLCEINVYLTYVCSFLSAWLVVAFTVERFIAVRHPLRRTSMCTVARAKVVLVSLTALSLILYVPNFWLTRIEIHDNMAICSLNPQFMVLATVINHVDFVLTFILPFLVIATLNAWISFMVWQSARIRRVLTHMRHSAEIPQRPVRSLSSPTKVTKMLLAVSTVFLCLNLPSYVLRVIVYVQVRTHSYGVTSGPSITTILQTIYFIRQTCYMFRVLHKAIIRCMHKNLKANKYFYTKQYFFSIKVPTFFYTFVPVHDDGFMVNPKHVACFGQ
jgi:hypothetical protein